VRENEAGKIAIHYRGQRLLFRELKAASKALSGGRDLAPSPAPHPSSCTRLLQPQIILGD